MRTPCFGADIVGPLAPLLGMSLGPMFEHGPSFRTFLDHGSLFSAHSWSMALCWGPLLDYGSIFRPLRGTNGPLSHALFWTIFMTKASTLFSGLCWTIGPLFVHSVGQFFEAICPFVGGTLCWGPMFLTIGPAGLGLILDYFLDHKPLVQTLFWTIGTVLVHSQNNHLWLCCHR